MPINKTETIEDFKRIEIDDGYIIEGRKVLNILDLKVEIKKDHEDDEDEKIYITGYANTKNKPDEFGDVPTGDNVYDLSRFKKNPVMLVDHVNSVGNIAGRFLFPETQEDEKGLKIKALLMSNPKTEIVQHAIESFKQGFGVAFSIGGRWTFGDKDNPTHLTKAEIHEISLVGIGADPRALTNTARPKKLDENTKSGKLDVLKSAIKEYRDHRTIDNLKSIRVALKKLNMKEGKHGHF